VPDWDDYFSIIALAVALRSKDPNLRVGAVIVSEDQVILSTGFNWLAHGIKELPERFTKQREKYKWITHAETNAIFNASRTGISLVGGTIYTTTFPCSLCCQAIVQAGIRRVFTCGKLWKKDPNGYQNGIEVLAEAKLAIDMPKQRLLDHDMRVKGWARQSAANDAPAAPAHKARKRGAGQPRVAAKRRRPGKQRLAK